MLPRFDLDRIVRGEHVAVAAVTILVVPRRPRRKVGVTPSWRGLTVRAVALGAAGSVQQVVIMAAVRRRHRGPRLLWRVAATI